MAVTLQQARFLCRHHSIPGDIRSYLVCALRLLWHRVSVGSASILSENSLNTGYACSVLVQDRSTVNITLLSLRGIQPLIEAKILKKKDILYVPVQFIGAKVVVMVANGALCEGQSVLIGFRKSNHIALVA